jgi:cytochrome b561
MSLKDTPTGYGWISIALHWITALVILYLLYLGNTIGGLEGGARESALLAHTSVAMSFYVFFAARIVWRLYYGHPQPTSEQRGWAFTLGKWTHMTMVFALALMIVSGPLMHWSYGNAIGVFDLLMIPSPFPASFALASLLHTVHAYSALVLFVGFLLHIGGVYKHTAFNQDGTLGKIFVADKKSRSSTSGGDSG